MRKVILHGRLGKKFGREFNLEVETCGEAIRAIAVQIRDFADELKKGAYEIVRGKQKSGLRLGEEDINTFRLGQADLHIIPVTKGSKRGGILKMILGVALVGIAIFASGGTLAAPLAGLTSASGGLTLWGSVAMVGLGMAVMGASQMFAKKEQPKDETKKEDSFTFSGPGNAYEQGNAVPLIYGRVITGSIPASSGIDVEDIPMNYTPSPGQAI